MNERSGGGIQAIPLKTCGSVKIHVQECWTKIVGMRQVEKPAGKEAGLPCGKDL